MKVTFARATMKRALDICKRINNNKEESRVWIWTCEENKIHLYTNRDERDFIYFHSIYSTNVINKHISFEVNPFTLESAFKEFNKNRVRELSFELGERNGKHYVFIEDVEVEVELVKYKQPNINQHTVNFDTETFKEKIDLVARILNNTVDSVTIGGRQLSVYSPYFYKRFNLDEDIKLLNLEPEYIRLISREMIWRKTDDKQISYSSDKEKLVIKHTANSKTKENSVTQMFMIRGSSFKEPKLKQLDTEIVHTFKIDAKQLLDSLSVYPRAVSEVYLYDDNNSLAIDPYSNKKGSDTDEDKVKEYPVINIPYEGNVKSTKVDAESIRSLVSGYEGIVEVNIKKYTEGERTFYLLDIYTPAIYSVTTVLGEPNYENAQKELDEILKEQEKLDFL